jgi:hypothetical protein
MAAGNVISTEVHEGSYLRHLRKLAGLNQSQIAERVAETIPGFNRPRLSMAECGHITLDPEEVSTVERVIVLIVQQRALDVVIFILSEALAYLYSPFRFFLTGNTFFLLTSFWWFDNFVFVVTKHGGRYEKSSI